MAEEVVITAEEQLLEDVLNDLDITYNDENVKKKIKDIMERGEAYLNDKYESVIDYTTDKQSRELLFSYCRYGRSNAIEQFEHDFKPQIVNLALRGAIVAQKAEASAEAAAEAE